MQASSSSDDQIPELGVVTPTGPEMDVGLGGGWSFDFSDLDPKSVALERVSALIADVRRLISDETRC